MNSQFTNKYILLWGMEFINARRSEKRTSSLAEFRSYRKDEVENHTSEVVESFFGAEAVCRFNGICKEGGAFKV